jgi:CheY-like chemotaxis protein
MLVLLVDDDQDDQEFFREAVKMINRSISCIYAKDGVEAFKLLNEQLVVIPDMIFLDVNMPLMDGKDFLIKIKKTSRLKNIPVVMYSTTSDEDEMKQFRILGAKDFLVKPPNFNQLVESLEEIIEFNP